MPRLPELNEATLSPEQVNIYREVKRVRGQVRGPFAIWLRNPELAECALNIVNAIREQRPPNFVHDDERLVYDITTELNETRTLSKPTFDRGMGDVRRAANGRVGGRRRFLRHGWDDTQCFRRGGSRRCRAFCLRTVSQGACLAASVCSLSGITSLKTNPRVRDPTLETLDSILEALQFIRLLQPAQQKDAEKK
jgi:hypothetical protein